MDKEVLQTPVVDFEIKNDILFVTYKEKVKIDLMGAKEIVKTRLEYTESKSYPILVIDAGIAEMDKEARDYSSDKEGGLKGVLAGALLLKDVYSEFFGNFFLRVTKPAIPTKIFTKKEEALEWLEQFKSQSVVK